HAQRSSSLHTHTATPAGQQKMLPSYFMTTVAALCALLPEATGFLAPSALMGSNTAAATAAAAARAAASSSNRVPALRMAEEAAAEEGEEAPAPTAADISKGIAHPEAIFTVPENILKVLPHRYPFAL
ncbi:unnamed protein product, partial [Ectocarpus fasciculatus]